MPEININQPDYRVYVSSTFSDLVQARRAAHDAIWSFGMRSIEMEDQGTQPGSAVAHALSLVDTATAFITILGHRYGIILPGYNISITELEYDRARERGIPILAFILDDQTPGRSSDIDRNSIGIQKVQTFRKRLLNEQFVSWFSSPDDLKAKLLTGLLSIRLKHESSIRVYADAAEAQRLQTSTNAIFISYRREDSIATCLHLAYRLEQHFGEAAVYMDEGSIPPGANWRDHIKEAIAQCGVVLAMIGPRWLEITDSTGVRRLDNVDDVLRQEVESALKRRIPVIPVLIDGTCLPTQVQLPESLRPLCDQQGLNLRNSKPDFGNDVQHIVEAVKRWITPLRSTA